MDTAVGERCYYTIVPPCAKKNQVDEVDSSLGVPLLVGMHGKGSCPLRTLLSSKWATKAVEECFVLVMPVGVTDPNVTSDACFAFPGGVQGELEDGTPVESARCCCTNQDSGWGKFVDPSQTQDLAFLRRMIEEVVQKKDDFVIDPTRIYLTGHSNGCMGSLAMAATHSDLVAAVCCHSGSLITDFDERDYDPVPIWMVHGARDILVPYNGIKFPNGPLGFLPLVDSFHYIADKNGCDADVVIETTLPDGTSLKRNSNCVNGAEVELVTLPNSGHSPYLNGDFTWETGAQTSVDTTAWAWDFCSSHSKAEIPQVFRESNSNGDPTSGGTPPEDQNPTTSGDDNEDEPTSTSPTTATTSNARTIQTANTILAPLGMWLLLAACMAC